MTQLLLCLIGIMLIKKAVRLVTLFSHCFVALLLQFCYCFVTAMIGKKVEVSLRLFDIFERNRVFIFL